MDQESELSTRLRFGSTMIHHSGNQALTHAHPNLTVKVRSNSSSVPLHFLAWVSDHAKDLGYHVSETPTEDLFCSSKIAEKFVGTKPRGLCPENAPIIAGIATNSEHLSPHGSCNSLAGGESLGCDKFESESMEETRTSSASTEARNTALSKRGVPRGALDLLVDAIRVASGTSFEKEDEPLCITHERKGIGNDHGGFEGIEKRKSIFVHMGVPVSQRRVIRRAKNVYKTRHYISAHVMLASGKASIGVDSMIDRKRREFLQAPDDENGHEAGIKIESKRDFKVVDVESHNARIKSRRSPVLPSKYYDSVLQPWKRGTRLKKELQ